MGRDGWCGILPRSGEYAIEVAAPERGGDYVLTVTVGAEVLDLPPMVFAVGHQIGEERTFLFVNRDGAARVVRVEGVLGCDAAAGRRVFCDDYYVDVGGAVAIDAPEVLERCRGPLPGPYGTQGPRDDDGQRLAWMCDDLDYGAIMEGQTPEARFELVLTDVRGRDPRVVWAETLTGSDYAPPRLRGWRADGAVVYVAPVELQRGWCCFTYSPRLTAIDVGTGEGRQVGDGDAFDAAVSPDGAWLAQSYGADRAPVGLTLRSLVDGAERDMAYSAGVGLGGDFAFSPDGAWLVWQEYDIESRPRIYRLRAMAVPAGEPFTLYEVPQRYGLKTVGWLTPDRVVVTQGGGEGEEGSYAISLPPTGRGPCLLSPHHLLMALPANLSGL